MWRSMGKGKTRDEESGRKVGGDAGLGEESVRKRRRERNREREGGVWRKSAGDKAGVRSLADMERGER